MYEQITRNKRRTVLYTALFVLLWLAVGAAVGDLVSVYSAAPQGGPAGHDVSAGIAVAAGLALVAVLFTVYSGTGLVLRVAGARLADPRRYPQLLHLVEALALGDGLPTPAVYVVDDPSPNAFAVGVSPAHAAVTVTSGLLAMMDREELEGVLAHELSHIKNYDTRLLLFVSTLIGMAGLLAGLLWRTAFFTRSRGRSGAQLTLIVIAAGTLLALIGFVLGPIIRLALSRRRESLADASGVELCRNPEGLIRALRKLQGNDRPPARFESGDRGHVYRRPDEAPRRAPAPAVRHPPAARRSDRRTGTHGTWPLGIARGWARVAGNRGRSALSARWRSLYAGDHEGLGRRG